MIHSIIQQITRQDPMLYQLMAAARPDANFKMISYLYYVADKKPEDQTAFRHIDLSPGRYVDTAGNEGGITSPNSPYPTAPAVGRGGLTIQSAIAIDDETVETGCTELVKGFHKHMPT